ncbi:ankyrin repeat protein, putative [Trichomonas vaginalis G3]|uniref:Ankyrin repeat protein, putative n=1 Tax=Trichomonas vaginalis (strain ATCC PRA-98 / G3) TaxID=412133 RepID=A2DL02_TRIV3|nr:spectrin binding [Trichomonas vaginalis G3]EAY18955.1 ankyrin repeat protein, putative [Trichomonas vaginalis G3]KAI5532021.1 spectrin binding [Trichomonas vaginalis G3]|eukprot:XP_001579941.1 ankyrin repeat protein [Trichomonas vaginalis G3]
MNKDQYYEVMALCKDYYEIFNTLYRLNTTNQSELTKIYQDINSILIKTKLLEPSERLDIISTASEYNCRYFKSYWTLYKMIYENDPEKVLSNSFLFNYFANKEYELGIDEELNEYDSKDYILDVHEENTIFRAIMDDDAKSFETFINSDGFNINQKLKSKFYPYNIQNDNQYSLLELCCFHGSVNCFKILRSKFQSEITYSCLQFSFLGRNNEIISECLKCQTPDKYCMEYAIISHNIEYIKFLMNEYKIEIDERECRYNNNLQALLLCIEQIDDINISFIYSLEIDFPPLWEYFLNHDADINARDNNGSPALFRQVMYNRKKAVEFLLIHGADVNIIDKDSSLTSINETAFGNRFDIAKILISFGADLNSKDLNGRTALITSALYNSFEISELYVKSGIDINAKDDSGNTALDWAIYNYSEKLMIFLLDNGADANSKDSRGCTALHYCSSNGYNEQIEILLSYGADINSKNNYGESVLHSAAEYEHPKTIELLISHGAEVTATDCNGKTALHVAAEHGCVENAEILILHGIDINAKDYNVKTSLHKATEKDRVQMIRFLISHGTDINSKDNNGDTALHYAAAK